MPTIERCLKLAALLLIGWSAAAGSAETRPDIVATNAFYYYEDVDAAWRFYADTLGFETVVDYGFAKIVRIAEASYLTLVEASEGMHAADEPKTVTLYLVTDELSRWYSHLVSRDVPVRVPYRAENGQASNSFVVDDPNGYALKFVRFNPHPNHDAFVDEFSEVSPVAATPAVSPGKLSVRVTAHAVYVESLDGIRDFHESLFDMTPAGRFDRRPAYRLSASGYLVLVEGADDLHAPTEQNGVTLSFLTSDVDAWFERATAEDGFELRTPEVLNEGGLVRVFVGYDPAGIFLEWDTFLDVPENEALLRYLR